VACGSQRISSEIASQPPDIQRGAALFSQRCSGCHTLDVVGAQGTTLNVRQRERVDGPNFNVRTEQRQSILYAIRNGGFSGAIMPQNVVVGAGAQDVAAFLAKYAGAERTPEITVAQPTTPTNTSGTPQNTTSTPAAVTASTGSVSQQALAQGKQVFTQNCGACHTLKDAGTTGTVGPNLDDLKPDQATVARQVTNGGGAMPAFKGQLTPAQIQAVSQYVSSVAGQ
jgi:mono/diheme cytochrome c family protein